MKNIISFLLVLICSAVLNAQTAKTTISLNNISATVLNGGDIFNSALVTNGFEVPKNPIPTGRHLSTIYSAGLWIGGLDAQKKLHLAACTYRQGENDFEPGPVSDSAYVGKNNTYDKIYNLSRSDIEYHKIHYNETPYGGNPVIFSWPGNGNMAKGEAKILAPFFDINKNSIYEPLLGEYPLIPGDACAFTIINDTRHKDSLRMEIHQFVYEYLSSDTNVNNTIFVSYKMFNRSNNNYDSLYMAQWIDYDIGNYTDDVYCSDSSRNLICAYNGDEDDEGIFGYGLNPPAMGCLFLNNKLFNTVTYNNDLSPHGNPITKNDYYNYLQGFYLNHDPVPKYPCGSNTGAPRDIRVMGTTRPFTFAAKKEYCFTVAHIFARGTGGALSSLALLKQNADSIQKLFDKNLIKDACTEYPFPTGISGNLNSNVHPTVYPNPASDKISLNLNSNDPEINYVISDATGRTILSGTVNIQNPQIDVHELIPGLYFIRLNYSQESSDNFTSKFIKQ